MFCLLRIHLRGEYLSTNAFHSVTFLSIIFPLPVSFAVFIVLFLPIFSSGFYISFVHTFAVFILVGCAVKIILVRIIQFCHLSHCFPLWLLGSFFLFLIAFVLSFISFGICSCCFLYLYLLIGLCLGLTAFLLSLSL